MNRGLAILIAALLAGIAAFVVTRERCASMMQQLTLTRDGHTQLPELAWLRREFQLTDEQFAKVAALHAAYRPTCETLCTKIQAATDQVKRVAGPATQVTPGLQAALQQHSAVTLECQTAMLTHLYETAACMSPAQARRYLDEMLPQVINMAAPPAHASPGH